jgi:ABC-type phosphate transport system substrate-binding protein
MKPMYLVVDEKPTRNVKIMVDFMTSSKGREMLQNYGYFTAAEILEADPAFTPPK